MVDVESVLARASNRDVEDMEWGRLEWMVSGRQGNSSTMTVGKCYIEPGHANPRHYHPNCDEVLVVLDGQIEHSLDDEVVAMGPGDTISIPQGAMHNARNVGEGQAVFVIAFSTADRQAVGE